MKKPKVGDRIVIKEGLFKGEIGEIVQIDETDAAVPYKISADNTEVGFGRTIWLGAELEFDILETPSFGQLELDFDELLCDDSTNPSDNEDVAKQLYCNCYKPDIISNTAYGESFEYCKKCKKERI